MLKVLIADDEKAIRESISQCIDWEEMGLQMLGAYANGVEIYDAIMNESPDIVLTDIKMPGMNGLELIEKISHTDLNIQFIVLSGFGEFEYAQTAMRYGVRHYLLKPCNTEQLKTALQEAREICCKMRAQHQFSEQHMVITHSLEESIIMDLLTLSADQPDNFNVSLLEPYQKHMDFSISKYQIHYLHGVSEDKALPCFNSIMDFHRLHAPGIDLHAIYVKDCLIVFFKDHPFAWTVEENLYKPLEFLNFFREEGHTLPNFTAAISEILTFTRYYETISYVTIDRLIPVCNYKNIINVMNRSCMEICRTAGNPDPKIKTEHKNWGRALLNQLNSIDTPDFFRQSAASTLFTLTDHDLCCSIVEATEIVLEMKKIRDIDALKKLFIPWLTERLQDSPDNTRMQGKMIRDIKDYVEKNLSNPDLTLKQIAKNHLFMNVDYVSKRFSRETGVKFSTYLREVRMQKAKELIAENDSGKLSTIADDVGLGNSPQYFSQVFKKYTGMTPSAYSKMIHGKE